MKIQTLGGCCKKSAANHEEVVEAVKELGLDVTVENVSDVNEIINLGVLATPGLVIDGKVLSAGRSLNVNQAKELIQKSLTSKTCCCDKCDNE